MYVSCSDTTIAVAVFKVKILTSGIADHLLRSICMDVLGYIELNVQLPIQFLFCFGKLACIAYIGKTE